MSASGDTIALTNNNRLIAFNQASPTLQAAVAVSGLQTNEMLLGIDIRPADGNLYGLGSTGRVYQIDASTGAATVKSTLAADSSDTTPFTGLSGTNFGLDFNPVVDRLRVVSDLGQNLRINVDTGATISDTNLSISGSTRTGITEAAYTNSFSAACRTTLYFLDTTNNRLVITNDPNGGTTSDVGNFGVTATAIAGFEITTAASGTNTAIAALTVANVPTIYTINLTNGAASSNGALTGLATNEVVKGLAIAPPGTAPVQAIGNVVGVTESQKLISFNNTAPQKLCTSTTVTGLNTGETILGIDVRPATGTLYALTSAARLVGLNSNTGAVLNVNPAPVTLTADGTTGFTTLNGTEFGVDFNPRVDRLRIVSDAGQNLRVNPDTGVTIVDANLNPAGSTATAAAYTNSFNGAGTTTLYVLDTGNDQLSIQGGTSGDPNQGDLAPVGSLNIDAGAIASFEINPINNTALAAVNLSGATTSELDTIDLTSGAATRVNTIGGGERVRSIAYNIGNPTPQIMAMTADGQLVSFKLQTQWQFDTAFPINGLLSGETLLGIDYRPANSKLYGVTNMNNLYTLDPTNGGATLVKALAPDPASTTAFTSLPTTGTFGVDFNPQADRLRVVSSTGINLRINVDTGLVIMDTNLSPATVMVSGNAYTSNFAGTTATKLYNLDLAGGALYQQNPPNAGTQTLVGQNLGLTFTAVGGFDIVGGADGLVLTALQTTAGGPYSLYRVNLTTGVATAVDATTSIGPTGTIITAMTTKFP